MPAAEVILKLIANLPSEIRPSAAAVADLTAKQRTAETSTNRYITSLAKADVTQLRAAVSAQKLATEEQRTALATLRLEQAQERAAKGGGSLTQAIGGIQSALNTVGLGLGVQQLVQFGVASGGAALSLRETERGLLAVAGSQDNYNKTLDVARQQQRLFGGTLQENIDGLTGLTITAKQSGADLGKLVDLSQRLGVLDPAQGTAGARIALSEALSGDPTSLAKRYEIPRAALAKLRDESTTAAEKLTILDQYLNKIGITSESVAGRIDSTRKAYNDLATAADNAKTAVGGFLADALAPAAVSGSKLLGADGFAGFVTGVTNLKAALSGLPPQTDAAAQANERFANSILRVLGLQQQQQPTGAQATGARDAEFGATNRLIGANTQLAGVMDDERRATQQAADMSANHAKLLADQAAATLNASQKTQDLASFQSALANIGGAVREGLITSGQGAIILAGQYDVTIERLKELIKLQNEAALRQQNVVNSIQLATTRAGVTAVGKKDIDIFGLSTPEQQKQSDQIIAQANKIGDATRASLAKTAQDKKAAEEKAAADAKRLQDAQNQLRLTSARTTAAKIAELQRQQAGADPVERLQLQNQILQLQQSEEKAAANTGRTKVSAAEKALNLQERTRDSVEKQYQTALDIEELTIRDRQQDREDAAKAKVAQRILGSANASADVKARAADALALISVQDRKRAAELAEKGATVNGSLINGRIFQSVGGGNGATPSVPAGAQGAGISAPSGGPSAGNTITLVLTDAAGGVIAKTVGPILFDQLLGSVKGVQLQKGL